MGLELVSAIIIVILVCVFIYLIIWTIGFLTSGLNKKREKQKEESKEKIENIRLRTIGCAKNYWYNKQDVEDCSDKRMKEKLYHYFDDVDDCITDLVVEMYDCALVRTEELSRIAYGESVFDNEKEEVEAPLEEAVSDNEEATTDILTSEGTTDILAKENEDDTEDSLDEETGVEDNEEPQEDEAKYKKALEEDENAATYKEELDATEYVGLSEEEKRRKVAIKAAIYEHWVGYVFQLYQLIDINANEDVKNRIRKELMHYGYNDIEILLHSPDSL